MALHINDLSILPAGLERLETVGLEAGATGPGA